MLRPVGDVGFVMIVVCTLLQHLFTSPIIFLVIRPP